MPSLGSTCRVKKTWRPASVTTTSAAGSAAAFRASNQRLIFLDESAVNTAMTPRYGRAPRGERVVEIAPRNYGEQTSIVGALRARADSGDDGRRGGRYAGLRRLICEVLAADCSKGDVVVLDNFNVHKASQVEEVAEAGERRSYGCRPTRLTIRRLSSAGQRSSSTSRGEGAHARGTRKGVGKGDKARQKFRHSRLVQALRLRGRIRMNAAIGETFAQLFGYRISMKKYKALFQSLRFFLIAVLFVSVSFWGLNVWSHSSRKTKQELAWEQKKERLSLENIKVENFTSSLTIISIEIDKQSESVAMTLRNDSKKLVTGPEADIAVEALRMALVDARG